MPLKFLPCILFAMNIFHSHSVCIVITIKIMNEGTSLGWAI